MSELAALSHSVAASHLAAASHLPAINQGLFARTYPATGKGTSAVRRGKNRAPLFFKIALGCALLLTVSCKPDKPKEDPPVEPAAATSKKEAPKKYVIKGHQFPVGPQLVFVPGKGVNAIRFGATAETIQRHMERPCDQVTPERCLYVHEAIEFFLKDDVLVRIKAHRRDSEVENPPPNGDKYFGLLSGIVQPRIMMGLFKHIVVEEYGVPDRTEPAKGADGLVERHHYDGIIFEYDKLENGNVVLGGIEVYPSKTAREYVPPPAGLVPGGPVSPPAPKSTPAAPTLPPRQ